MIPTATLLSILLVLSSIEAAPSDRRSWGRALRRGAENLQTFSGNIGAAAPAVTSNGDSTFSFNNQRYNRLVDALVASCISQASACSTSSISDKGPCWGSQYSSCNAAANQIADGYNSRAVQYSSSVASANYAKATAARTVSGDLQTFTGAVGGVAPPVTGSPTNWWSSNIYFYRLIDALSDSCYKQQALCNAAGSKVNWAYELTVDNCNNVQLNACLSNARNVDANYGKSSAAASPTSSADQNAAYSSSAAAYSSASAYSASVNNANAAASAAAYSAQSSASAYSAAQSLAAYSAAQSAAAYSAQSAAVYSASSAAAYSAQASAAAYSAAQSAAAYSAAQSAAAYSAQSAAAVFSATSASAYSASSLAAYSASLASASAAPQAPVIPSGWSLASTACIAEGTKGRALTGASSNANDMTWEKCTSYCTSKGFALAGLEYSSECYCGAVLSNGASLDKSSTQCNMKASGNKGQTAGGPGALTLFIANDMDKSKFTPDLTGAVLTIPDGWTLATGSSGTCVLEGSSGRALVAASTAANDMTVGKCIDFCKSKGSQYAGLEYSRECFCGNDIINGASLSRTTSCDMQCAGAPGTICGGPGSLSIYVGPSLKYTNTQVGQYSKQGCIQEVGGRALTGASTAGQDMTLEKCTGFCQQGGFAFAGLEYGGECYCGNSLSNGASFSSWSTECKMPCNGNPDQICGGPNAISLYSTQAGTALIGA